MTLLLRVVMAELLKLRGSLAVWMVLVGGLFTSGVITAARLWFPSSVAALHQAENFWLRHWRSSSESSAVFFLPMGMVLATALLAQIEFRNNAWKQVHALPVRSGVVYLAKLLIVLLMLVAYLAVFCVGVWASAAIPSLLLTNVEFPAANVPWAALVSDALRYFVAALPITAIQFGLSLRFRNFLVPVGIGFLGWLLALGSLSWQWNFLLPYSHTMHTFLEGETQSRAAVPVFDVHTTAVAYFFAAAAVGYVSFAKRRT